MNGLMNYEDFKSALTRYKLIAILRGILPQDVIRISEILIECGIPMIEVTLNSPDALKSISMIVKELGNKAFIGAGTVLTPDEASAVADTGAQFIISPNVNTAVIRKTKECGLISIPGFLTPTEAFTAVDAGADFLKCFPAGTMGVSYLKDIKAVLKKPIIATGGVDKSNMKDFLSQALGLGIGSALFKSGKSDENIKNDALEMIRLLNS